MGHSHSVNDTLKKNQEYISDMNRTKMERWIQMHHQMKERELALEVSRMRELFYWVAPFSAITLSGIVSRYQATQRPLVLASAVPLVFGIAYLADMAYGSKLHRIRAEAEMIMQHEPELLEWPCGLPTVSSIDQARVEAAIEKKMHPSPP